MFFGCSLLISFVDDVVFKRKKERAVDDGSGSFGNEGYTGTTSSTRNEFVCDICKKVCLSYSGLATHKIRVHFPTDWGKKRAKTEEHDSFFLLHNQPPTKTPSLYRKCPQCEKQIPMVGSFYWLHLSQCDIGNFWRYVEGSKEPPVAMFDESETRSRKDPVQKAKEIARVRNDRVSSLLEEVFDNTTLNSELRKEVQQMEKERIELVNSVLGEVAQLENMDVLKNCDKDLEAYQKDYEQLESLNNSQQNATQVPQLLKKEYPSFDSPFIQDYSKEEKQPAYEFQHPSSLFKL